MPDGWPLLFKCGMLWHVCILDPSKGSSPSASPVPQSTGDSVTSLFWAVAKVGWRVLRAETILASLTFKSSHWQPGAGLGLGLGLADEWAEGADHTQGGLLRRGQDVRV